MCAVSRRLIWSIMAARVVLFPLPAGPVTRIRPRDKQEKFRDDFGKKQFGKVADFAADEADGQGDGLPLEMGIDSESAQAGNFVGKIEVAFGFKYGPPVAVEQRFGDGGALVGGEGGEPAGLNLGIDAKERRRSGVQMNVGSASFHRGAKDLIDHSGIYLSAGRRRELMFLNRNGGGRW